MAKKIFTIKIYCTKCNTLLYKYKKGGSGSLVKCLHHRIIEDLTEKLGVCPKCQNIFAKKIMIHGKPANKIIRGRVYVKGKCG